MPAASNKNNYIAFVSFENSVVHEKVARFLNSFHFNNIKVDVKVNQITTPVNKKDENKRKFKKTLERYYAQKNKRKNDDELENNDEEPVINIKSNKKFKINNIQSEDSNDWIEIINYKLNNIICLN